MCKAVRSVRRRAERAGLGESTRDVQEHVEGARPCRVRATARGAGRERAGCATACTGVQERARGCEAARDRAGRVSVPRCARACTGGCARACVGVQGCASGRGRTGTRKGDRAGGAPPKRWGEPWGRPPQTLRQGPRLSPDAFATCVPPPPPGGGETYGVGGAGGGRGGGLGDPSSASSPAAKTRHRGAGAWAAPGAPPAPPPAANPRDGETKAGPRQTHHPPPDSTSPWVPSTHPATPAAPQQDRGGPACKHPP